MIPEAEAYLAGAVADAPPLTHEQVEQLAAVFAGVNGEDPRCDEQRGSQGHRGGGRP
jgi:hypothetical protein